MIRVAALALCLVPALVAGQSERAEAVRLFSIGQFDQAAKIVRTALAQTPRDGELRFLLGAALVELGQHAEAVKELREALKLSPGNRDAAKLLAAELVGQRQYASAIAVLEPLTQPDEEIFLLLAQAYHDRSDNGDNDRAIALATKALTRFPKSSGLLTTQGLAFRDAGRLTDARKSLEAALAIDPALPQARSLLADVLSRQGHHDLAIPVYRDLLAASSNDIDARIGLSRSLAAAGSLQDALGEMERARQTAPDNARVRLELSQLYSKLGHQEHARAEAEAFRRLSAAKTQ
jgi:Flp pilus assembly protein TadD